MVFLLFLGCLYGLMRLMRVLLQYSSNHSWISRPVFPYNLSGNCAQIAIYKIDLTKINLRVSCATDIKAMEFCNMV